MKAKRKQFLNRKRKRKKTAEKNSGKELPAKRAEEHSK